MKKLITVLVLVVACLQAGTTQETAQKIMGKNYIGIADVQNSLGVKYTPEQLKTLAAIPYSEATLRETATSHVLVAGYPLSTDELVFHLLKGGIAVYDFQKLVFQSGGELFAKHDREELALWLVSNKRINFAEFKRLFRLWKEVGGGTGREIKPWFDTTAPTDLRWYLLRKEIALSSTPKNYNEAHFRDLLYAVTLYRIVRGEELFSKTIAFSVDKVAPSEVLGALTIHFDRGNLIISGSYADTYRHQARFPSLKGRPDIQ